VGFKTDGDSEADAEEEEEEEEVEVEVGLRSRRLTSDRKLYIDVYRQPYLGPHTTASLKALLQRACVVGKEERKKTVRRRCEAEG
jgi:hypothetical protein